jgi:hypothetical protein
MQLTRWQDAPPAAYSERTADEATAITPMTNTIHAMDLDTAELFAEIDACLEQYRHSIDRGLALAAEMRQIADATDAGLADARAELEEWYC